MDNNEDRRKNDEAFRLKIVEQQAEIKTLLSGNTESLKALQTELTQYNMRLLNVEHTLWGGPGSDNVGLLERHRRLQRNWAVFFSILIFLGNWLGDFAKKFTAQWFNSVEYNSPAQRWKADQKRPKVRVYKIYQKAPQPDEDETQDSQPKAPPN